jgi:quercetin dioxygenase-like cupin family protein
MTPQTTTDPQVHTWENIEPDHPIAKLSRQRIKAERIMVARVELEPGCEVAMHSHEMEQVGCVMSGRVLFRLGEPGTPDYREIELQGGQVVELPSNFPHGVVALDHTVIFDILSPPGEMGVDNQK